MSKAASRTPSGTATEAELARIAALRLRIDAGGSVAYPPGAVIGWRRIPDFELVWTDAGSATFAGPEGETVLTPGRVLLVRPGERHVFRMDRRRMLRHGFVHFSVAPAAARLMMAWPRTVRLPPGSLLATVLAALARRCEGGAVERTANLLALRLALALYREGGSEAEPADGGSLDPQIAAILAAAQRRWTAEPGWMPRRADLTRLSGLSASALGRLFRAAFGCGAVAALRRWQVGQAAQRLGDGASLASLARASGFADPDRFARVFHAVYGLSPRAARARLRAGSWMPQPSLRRLAAAGGRRYPSYPASEPSFPA